MADQEQAPVASPSAEPSSPSPVPFVPNGRPPKGEFKTWKKKKEEGEAGPSFKERRAKRVAAHQAAMAAKSKSKVRDDGIRWIDAHEQFTKGEDAIVDDEDVNTDTTWEDVSYDVIRESMAREMLEADQSQLDSATRELYRQETSTEWDRFYTKNKQNFFKDRNYLGRAFPDLATPSAPVDPKDFPTQAIMEVGSGVGNSLFPMMESHPDKFFYAFDCSQRAIELLKEQERYSESRAHAFVCDITREDIADSDVKDGSLDFVTMIFMLSAVAPEQQDDVLQKINRKLKLGGAVLFRDYGVYDMTQMRFYAKKTLNKLGENFYRRSDGTFTYFFSLEVLADLFQRNGFEVAQNTFDTRVLSNRKRKLRMYRVWAQCKFVKVRDCPRSDPTVASSSSS